MTPCALCSETSRETVLAFHHVRRAERVTLEIGLCEGCGDRIEKHLKRAVPKSLMAFTVIDRLAKLRADAARRARGTAGAPKSAA